MTTTTTSAAAAAPLPAAGSGHPTDLAGSSEFLSIGEVSARTGLSTHTLRFYEQQGLFISPVRRSAAGRRLFTVEEVTWLQVCTKLRSSGMPLAPIHRYAQLVRRGPSTVDERLRLLQEHEVKVQQQVADLQEALSVIHGKVALYTEHLAAGTADELWRDGPQCDQPAGLAPAAAGPAAADPRGPVSG